MASPGSAANVGPGSDLRGRAGPARPARTLAPLPEGELRIGAGPARRARREPCTPTPPGSPPITLAVGRTRPVDFHARRLPIQVLEDGPGPGPGVGPGIGP